MEPRVGGRQRAVARNPPDCSAAAFRRARSAGRPLRAPKGQRPQGPSHAPAGSRKRRRDGPPRRRRNGRRARAYAPAASAPLRRTASVLSQPRGPARRAPASAARSGDRKPPSAEPGAAARPPPYRTRRAPARRAPPRPAGPPHDRDAHAPASSPAMKPRVPSIGSTTKIAGALEPRRIVGRLLRQPAVVGPRGQQRLAQESVDRHVRLGDRRAAGLLPGVRAAAEEAHRQRAGFGARPSEVEIRISDRTTPSLQSAPAQPIQLSITVI